MAPPRASDALWHTFPTLVVPQARDTPAPQGLPGPDQHSLSSCAQGWHSLGEAGMTGGAMGHAAGVWPCLHAMPVDPIAPSRPVGRIPGLHRPASLRPHPDRPQPAKSQTPCAYRSLGNSVGRAANQHPWSWIARLIQTGSAGRLLMPSPGIIYSLVVHHKWAEESSDPGRWILGARFTMWIYIGTATHVYKNEIHECSIE